MDVLVGAWHAIRRNAETSQTSKTKQEAREFGNDLPRNLSAIQRRLRDSYVFAKAFGATPAKGKGKSGKRPIVVAPLDDRIVQRAILDVLQDAKELPELQAVLSTPTSIGGIKGRGVDCGISIFAKRVKEGDRFVAGSDISGFFTKIPKQQVIDFIAEEVSEPRFIDLIERALTVELENAESLSEEDRRLFPTGPDGVAQGCPLSALAGNIVLRDFDRAMNEAGRGITCVRYIDDFLLIGRSEQAVQKALASARQRLQALDMDIYDPTERPDKAFVGQVGQPHVFLGYVLIPDSFPPSDKAQASLLSRIDDLIKSGKLTIRKIITDRPVYSHDRSYVQTVSAINDVAHGWRHSFRASSCTATFKKLDGEITRKLDGFHGFFRAQTANLDPLVRRSALGVSPFQAQQSPGSSNSTRTTKAADTLGL